MANRLVDLIPGYKEILEEEAFSRNVSYIDVEKPLETSVKAVSIGYLCVSVLFYCIRMIVYVIPYLRHKMGVLLGKVTEKVTYSRDVSIPIKPLTPYMWLTLELLKSPIVCGGEIKPSDVIIFLWIISDKDHGLTERQFAKQYKYLNTEEVLSYITTYLEDSFADNQGGRDTGKAPQASIYTFIIGILAREYGWTEDNIMNIPFKRVFQYIKEIMLAKDSKAILWNKSDRERVKLLKGGS